MTTKPQRPKESVGKGDLLKIISNALDMGSINAHQARQMKTEAGIIQSDFTKSRSQAETRKAKRKSAKKARKLTLFKGFKGQKLNNHK